MIFNKNIWIAGFGGIAKAIFEKLVSNNKITIISTKKDLNIENNFSNCLVHTIDSFTEENIEFFIKSQNNTLPDYLIITCGILYDKTHRPEKTITNFNQDWLNQSLRANVLPCAIFAKYLTPKLNKKDSLVMVCFSARVSSISDNKLGGWHSYRMSKTMLNMLIKNIAIEWQFKSPSSVIFGYHPGTVDTNLSKPFQGSVNNKIFQPQEAAEYFISVLESINSENSGYLYDWKNEKIKF